MKRISITLLVSIIAAFLAVSCDTPAAQSNSGGVRASSSSTDAVVMKVNGDPIPAAEILSSNYLRNGLRQFVYYHNLRRIAAEEGVKADPNDIDEHIALLKQHISERGDNWEKYLTQLMISEDEFRSNIEESLLQDGIVEKRIGVTEEKMRKIWEEQKDKVIDEYMRDNFLPEAERDAVTYEQCHDVLYAKVIRIEGVPILGDLQAELIDTATLEMTCMSEEDAKLFEFLILESAKHKTGKPLEEYEKALEEKAAVEESDSSPAEASEGAGVDSSIAGSK